MSSRVYKSPIGELLIRANEERICSIQFLDNPIEVESRGDSKVIDQVEKELNSYFAGDLIEFKSPLQPEGTEFQKQVWNLLIEIPYGKTSSYLEMSKLYGDEKAIRALASANGANPIAILIPCHRVIGTDGSLTGYAGGLWRKEYLLDLEGGVKRLF